MDTTLRLYHAILEALPGFGTHYNHTFEYNYVLMLELASEISDALMAGNHEHLPAVFEAVERAWCDGDGRLQDLLGAGLYEALQDRAMSRFDPPDLLDAWFGPTSLRIWKDLIEAWAAPGIRTIADWRRVVVDGSVRRFTRTGPDGVLDVKKTDDGAVRRWQPRNGRLEESALSKMQTQQLFDRLRPLIADEVARWGATPDELARYGLDQPAWRIELGGHPAHNSVITLGFAASKGRRYAAGSRQAVYVLDPTMLLDDWSGRDL